MMKSIFRKFHKDERGTALTEFVITLPLFIMVFAGILAIGSANEQSTRVWVSAYKLAFDAAVQVQKAPLDPHMVGIAGSGFGLAHMNPLPKETTGVQRAVVLASDAMSFGGLALNGTMGESAGRVYFTDFGFTMGSNQGSGNKDEIEQLSGMEDLVTSDIDDIVGNSTYVKDLYNDSVSPSSFGGGGGALGVLNSVISGLGIRPTIATGTRYGTVLGEASDSFTIGPLTYNPSAAVSTLVAPMPINEIYGGELGSELVVTAVTRLTMESTDAYSDLLGIQWSNPLDGSNLNTDCHDDHFNHCRPFSP